MNVYDLIAPVETTGIARLAIADEERLVNQFMFGRWFPRELVDGIDFEYSTGTDRTYSDAAGFRAFDEPPRLGKRPGITRVRGELAPISIEYELSEYDKLQHRAVMGQGGNQQLRDLLEPVVNKDIVRGVDAIERRLEFVRRDLLLNGTAVFTEGGMDLELDVERDPARSSTVATAWSNIAATVLDDEAAVMDTMEDDEDLGPENMWAMMNRATWRDWKDTTQVKGAIPTTIAGGLVTDELGQQVRRDAELPDVLINNSRGKNPLTGTVEKLMPDGYVLYLPKFPVGETQYGVPAIADEPDIGLAYQERPGPVAYLTKSIKPLVTSTVIDALVMSLLRDPDATYSLDTSP